MVGKFLTKYRGKSNLSLHGLLLVVLATSWLAGIILSSWFALPQAGWLAATGLALLASGVFWRKPTERLLALVLLCLCLGAWRYTAVVPSNDPAAVQRLLG
ncbi:MAG: hypothetical protein ACRDHZ_21860, partial [Ktedonobacteraceae bacterium]